jgi:hypothetical protein
MASVEKIFIVRLSFIPRSEFPHVKICFPATLHFAYSVLKFLMGIISIYHSIMEVACRVEAKRRRMHNLPTYFRIIREGVHSFVFASVPKIFQRQHVHIKTRFCKNEPKFPLVLLGICKKTNPNEPKFWYPIIQKSPTIWQNPTKSDSIRVNPTQSNQIRPLKNFNLESTVNSYNRKAPGKMHVRNYRTIIYLYFVCADSMAGADCSCLNKKEL